MADHPKSKLLKPQPDTDEEMGEWQDLLKDVDVSTIPLTMVKILRVHLDEGQKLVFPIKQWIAEGSSISKIENMLNKWQDHNKDHVEAVDYVLDIEQLKTTVTAETNKALKDI